MTTLSLEYLKECVSYDPEVGEFEWCDRPLSHFSSYRGHNGWKSKCLGKKAGHPNGLGYITVCIDQHRYKAHRLAWFYYYGKWPDHEIDHINGVRNDNRIENLRDVPRSINGRNCKISHRNKSGVIGVTFNRAVKKWHAQIYQGGKNRHLGLYNRKIDAVRVRKEAESKLGYHPNHGRPDPVAELKGDGQ